MAIDATTNFSRVRVDFDMDLGINDITAYRNAANPGEDPVWRAVEALTEYHSSNDEVFEGIYNAGDPSFAECVRRLRLGTAELVYSFNNRGNITVDEIEGDSSKIFGHILDHDPVYREIKRQERVEAGVPDIVPIDKIYHQYGDKDNGVPDLPSDSLTNNDLIAHVATVVASGWKRSPAEAETATSTIENKTLYKILVTYYKDGAIYKVSISRVEEVDLSSSYQASIPVVIRKN